MQVAADHTPDQSAEPALAVRNLVKRFSGITAVDDLSFDIAEDDIVGFIGPNGAGKSTTFDCITGRLKPTAGTVTFDGEEVTGLPPHAMVKRGVARTFQDFRPLYDRSVIENVEMAFVEDRVFTLSGLRGRTRDRSRAMCERVGLGDRVDQMPDELPHGQLLRLELARALATQPDLLLVDEPFAGLAQSEIREVSALLREVNDEGLTLVVVDHNMKGLLPLVDYTIVINFGSLIAEGTPEEIQNDETVQAAYLGEGF